jgi:hypothetical protein
LYNNATLTLTIITSYLFIEESGVNHDAGDAIRVNVRRRATILQVTVALRVDMPGNANGSTTVSNTRAEGPNVSGLVTARQPQIIVLSVDRNVLVMPLRQLLDSSLDMYHTSGLTHGFGAVVGVATGAVPVTREGFRMERDLNTPLFGDTDEEVACHPEVVSHGDTLARADLELPLRGHDLSVDTANVDAGIETCTIMRLNEITCKDFASTSTAVVWALGAGEAALGPTVWGAVSVKQSVLLFETEPRNLSLGGVH